MKTVLIAIVMTLLIFSLQIKSQDRDPNQKSFFYYGQNRLLNSTDSLFSINRFHRGWQWASGRKMTDALNMTSGQTTDSIPTSPGSPVWMAIPASRFADSVDLTIDLKGVYANGLSLSPLNSMMMTFEPTLKINNPGQFETRSGDPTNPVFGFNPTWMYIVVTPYKINRDFF